MSVGLIGQKRGMTRCFTDEGSSIPVTVVEVQPNTICQVKTVESDGYSAIQVSTGSRKQNKVRKPIAGHFAKHGVQAGMGLWEFRINSNDETQYEPKQEITLEIFETGQKVDVTGVTKGKGFAGTVKRHNFAMQDATHGNSISHRAPGSIGQNQSPGKVFKGKKMAGQMGNVKRTIQSLEIVSIEPEKNLIMIKGSLPGAVGGELIIKPGVKQREKN